MIQQLGMKKLTLQDQEGGFFKSKIMLQPIIANITSDLVSDNIIKDKSDLVSFKLTNTVLVVNGKKQSDDIHEKLKQKYLQDPQYPINQLVIKDPNFGLHYDAPGQGMGIGISTDKGDQ
jgi:hypothetical protein